MKKTIFKGTLGLGLAAIFVVSATAISMASYSSGILGRAESSLTLSSIQARIFTPNGDGANDKVTFHIDNPEFVPVSGRIYDLPGARVADLQNGPESGTTLQWDGKDDSGRTVSGGMYLYQLDFNGKTVTGTVIVAR